jgi:hypothetical protein
LIISQGVQLFAIRCSATAQNVVATLKHFGLLHSIIAHFVVKKYEKAGSALMKLISRNMNFA